MPISKPVIIKLKHTGMNKMFYLSLMVTQRKYLYKIQKSDSKFTITNIPTKDQGIKKS